MSNVPLPQGPTADTGRQAVNGTRTMPRQPPLTIIPMTFQRACAFIAAHHRHHRPPQGLKFAVGVASEGALVGVAVVGRPVARHLDDGFTAEVTRTCTDGTPNANSALYGASWRAARALGYQRLITYTQQEESGTSLRAAGFKPTANLTPHRGWDRPNRRRQPSPPGIARTRWEVARTPDTNPPADWAAARPQGDQPHTGVQPSRASQNASPTVGFRALKAD
jgi:hypothetical protein